MASLVVVGVGAALGAGTTGATAGAVAVVTAAALVAAAYYDNKYVYPKLFPQADPQLPAITGIDTMTGDDGSPGHTSWGRYALVGGHVLWFENFRDDVTQTQQASKKGGATQTVVRKLADVGIGLTRNLVTSLEQIQADQKVFWRRDPNNVLWSDYRVVITVVGSNLRLTTTDPSVLDFTPLFTVGEVVKLARAVGPLDGWYRVANVTGQGTGSGATQYMELSALSGQSIVAGSGGTASFPMEVRRMDASIVDHALIWSSPSSVTRLFIQPAWNTAPTLSGTNPNASFYRRPIAERMPVGTRLLFENFTSAVNGLWDVAAIGGGSGYESISIEPRSGQGISNPTHTSATNCGRITILGDEGFLEPESVVPPSGTAPLQMYLGTQDQVYDSDLASIYGSSNVHGYRGLARTTIRGLNLTQWGDRVPQMAGVVKVSDVHTTHHVIRTLMREAFDNDDERYDLARLAPDQLLGYTRRGPQLPTTTLQPLATAYDIEAQEQGDVISFFKGRDADQFQLTENELGAYVGRTERIPDKFTHQRSQDRDLPLRLSLFYRDPFNDLSRTEKLQRSSSPDDDQAEQVAIDLDPLVLYPWQAQNVVNRLFAQAIVGRDQGAISLPPSRLDMSVGDRVTFTALNWNEELIDVTSGEIDHTTQIAGIEVGSVSVEVDFETSGTCRLVDDASGATNGLYGFPASVTGPTSAIDYATGEITFSCDEAILSARIRYEFSNPWRMRVARVRKRVNRITELDVVAVAESFPVLGSPVQPNNPSVHAVVRAAVLQTSFLDIAATNVALQANPGALFAAAPGPGSTWHGAGVFSSLDGTSYSLRGVIGTPVTMGYALDALPTGNLHVVDWINTLAVRLTSGSLADATLEQIGSGLGTNMLLVGNEILAFLRAAIQSDGTYILSGLIRGLRDTGDEMGAHAIDDRVVLLDQIGLAQSASPGLFEEFQNPGDIGRTVWIKIAPSGGVLDDYTAQQITFTANNVRPFAPAGLVQGDIATYGYAWDPRNPTYDATAWNTRDITVRWFRRSRALLAAFGAGGLAPLLEPTELYEVQVLKNGAVLTARTTIVGGQNTGSSRAHRMFRYTLAEQTADVWVSGDVAIIRVRQIGVGGANGYSKPADITWTLP